jgi:FO synthase
MEETISRMAGSEFGSAKTPHEIAAVAAGAGRPVRQRTTSYGEVGQERLLAAASSGSLLRTPLPVVGG